MRGKTIQIQFEETKQLLTIKKSALVLVPYNSKTVS